MNSNWASLEDSLNKVINCGENIFHDNKSANGSSWKFCKYVSLFGYHFLTKIWVFFHFSTQGPLSRPFFDEKNKKKNLYFSTGEPLSRPFFDENFTFSYIFCFLDEKLNSFLKQSKEVYAEMSEMFVKPVQLQHFLETTAPSIIVVCNVKLTCCWRGASRCYLCEANPIR